MNTPSFNPKAYWEERLSKEFGLHGVGRINWGIYYNRWSYRLRRKVFLRFLRASGRQIAGTDCLDIGSGTGFYIDRWKELGARRVSGCDLTEVVVGNLRNKYPADEFHQLDIGDRGLGLLDGRQFDWISCIDVLYHLVDDERYAQALKHIYSLLKPGGCFVLTDLFTHTEGSRYPHVVYRTRAEVENTLREAGFETGRRRPIFVLMNEPVDTRSHLLRGYWWLLQAMVTRFHLVGFVAGAALYPIESLLVAVKSESPTTEIMLCRRPKATSR